MNNQKEDEKIPKPVKERDDLDLLELVSQLNSRLVMYPSEFMHNAYWEARNELQSRLAGYAASTPFHHPEQLGKEAIEFVGWIIEQEYEVHSKDAWMKINDSGQSPILNRSQLYKLFNPKWAEQEAPGDEKQFRWVKASERLPNCYGGIVVFRQIDTINIYAIYVLEGFDNHSNYWGIPLNRLEWREQYPSPTPVLQSIEGKDDELIQRFSDLVDLPEVKAWNLYRNEVQYNWDEKTEEGFKLCFAAGKAVGEYDGKSATLSAKDNVKYLIENEEEEWYFPSLEMWEHSSVTGTKTRYCMWLNDANKARQYDSFKEATDAMELADDIHISCKVTEHIFPAKDKTNEAGERK